jgi:hypothetical protein
MWEQAFKTKALADFQSHVDALLEEVVCEIDKAAKAETRVDMGMSSNLYSFDGQS